MPKPPRLHVIHGTPAPDTPKERVRKRLRAARQPAAMLECPRCTGHELVETRTGAVRRNGKTAGGTRTLLCVGCLQRGERVVVA